MISIHPALEQMASYLDGNLCRKKPEFLQSLRQNTRLCSHIEQMAAINTFVLQSNVSDDDVLRHNTCDDRMLRLLGCKGLVVPNRSLDVLEAPSEFHRNAACVQARDFPQTILSGLSDLENVNEVFAVIKGLFGLIRAKHFMIKGWDAGGRMHLEATKKGRRIHSITEDVTFVSPIGAHLGHRPM